MAEERSEFDKMCRRVSFYITARSSLNKGPAYRLAREAVNLTYIAGNSRMANERNAKDYLQRSGVVRKEAA